MRELARLKSSASLAAEAPELVCRLGVVVGHGQHVAEAASAKNRETPSTTRTASVPSLTTGIGMPLPALTTLPSTLTILTILNMSTSPFQL